MMLHQKKPTPRKRNKQHAVPNSPHIHRPIVQFRPQQQLRGSIPSGHDAVGETTFCTPFLRYRPSKTKVRNLQATFFVDEKIGRFDVSVQDMVLFGSRELSKVSAS